MCHSKTAVPQTAVVFDCGLVMRFDAANECVGAGRLKILRSNHRSIVLRQKTEMLKAYAFKARGLSIVRFLSLENNLERRLS